ncbi:MAG: class I SAM-dependent methyltransferase [Candidatus Lokiarchaeota archaeon]|nr:class I SAM-dependent methyltransferase [Candidatus Lokiarchaeota archaeon]
MDNIENFYKEYLSWDKSITDILGKSHSTPDRMILDRTPKLEFLKDGKIDIEKLYREESEVRSDEEPYNEYYQCILQTFQNDKINTFCDVGCSTGHLVSNMLSYCDSCGIEYFNYQKDNANEQVKECINILDIRDPIDMDIKFDLVNCTEVAEHVDPKCIHTFLDNIKKITGKYLILTWSSTYPPNVEGPPQHVTPLEFDEVCLLMENWGFTLDKEMTDRFLNKSKQCYNFYYWWRESLSIWRV